MMHSSFDGQKLHSAFTLNIVEIIRRTQIQPNPQVPVIPIGIAVVSLLTLSMLYLFVSIDQFSAIGKLVGAPILSETRIAEVGEIPVDVVMLSNTSVVSSGDGKKDLGKNSRLTNGVQAADTHTEAATGTQNEPIARLGNGTISDIIYSPDGKLIAATGAIGIWLYDAETPAEVGMISGGARVIAFSPDGQMLASGSGSEPTAFLWNVATRKRIGSMLLPDRRGITALTYALDGKTLAVGYTNGDIALWDTATQQKTALLDTASSVLWTLAFSPDGQLLASGGYEDSTISLWDVKTQTLLGAFDGHTRDTNPSRYNPKHQLSTLGAFDGHTRYTKAQNHGVSTIAFSPDGKTLASGSGFDCTVRLWDVAVRTEIALLLELDTYELEGITSVVFSPNGTLLASASDDAAIRMWDTRTLEQIGVLETRSGGVTSLAFQPDGKRLASLNGRVAATPRHKGGDMAIRLWEVEKRTQIAAAQHHYAAVTAVSLQPNGRFLASGHHDGVVVMWDVQNREKVGVLRGLNAIVESVAFSPDGTLLASSERENTRLWDVQKRKQIAVFKNRAAIVESVAFSPDGKTLASVDYKAIRLWDTKRKNGWRVATASAPNANKTTDRDANRGQYTTTDHLGRGD